MDKYEDPAIVPVRFSRLEFGCSNAIGGALDRCADSSVLSDHDFVHNDVTYQFIDISGFSRRDGSDSRFDVALLWPPARFPHDIRTRGRFNVDPDGNGPLAAVSLPFSNATYNFWKATWHNPGITWTEGQTATLSITLAPPPPTPPTLTTSVLSGITYTGSVRTAPAGSSAWRESYPLTGGTALSATISPGTVTCPSGATAEFGWYRSTAPTTRVGSASSAGGVYTLSHTPTVAGEYRALAYCVTGTGVNKSWSTAVNLMRGGAVTLDGTAPTVKLVQVDGNQLIVVFTETMGAAKAANNAFTVNVTDATNPTVSRYSPSGDHAILTLSSGVPARRTVTLDYAKPGSGPVLQDVAGNALASFSAKTVYNITIEPSVDIYSPRNDAVDIPTNRNLVLTFSEPVTKGSGNVTIKPTAGGSNIVIPVTDSQVSIGSGADDNKVTIDPTNNLSANTAYAVRIDAGAFTDLKDSNYGGIGDDTTWSFTTGAGVGGQIAPPDTTGPTVVSFTPSDGDTGVGVAANLMIIFDEPVKKRSTGGAIRIRPSGGGQELYLDVRWSEVSIGSGASRNVVSITPRGYSPPYRLSKATSYRVRITPGAFTDYVGNAYAGITNDTTWNFTTSASGQPEPKSVSLDVAPSPVSEGLPVTVTATLSATLSADVSIPLTVTRGTSEEGDHDTLSSITVSAGRRTGSGEIATHLDADGDDETFTVALDTANLPSSVTAGSPASQTVTITDTGSGTPPAVFPAAPPDLEATAGAGEVTLSWGQVAGATGWQVRQGSGDWTDTGSAETTFTVTGLTNGTEYRFRVRATSLGVLTGTASESVSATPAAAPGQPQNLGAIPGDGEARLFWDALSGATHWQVRHRAQGEEYGAWTDIPGGGSITGHVVTGLANGTFHVLEVRAVNGTLYGPASAAGATPAAPGPRTAPEAVDTDSISVVHGGSSLSVSWDAPDRATHYDVTYQGNGVDARAAWNRAGTSLTITCDVREGYDNCVSAQHAYTVGLRARNAGGESGWAYSSPPASPPGVPDAVEAASIDVVHNGGSLSVSWDAPARATHYDVTYQGNGVDARAAWNRAGTSLTITCDVREGYDNCVSAQHAYTVGLRARNAGGESGWVYSGTPAAPPALGVADATVAEPGAGESATLDFVVTLNRAASGTVTVDYATADGTATAGADYTAASGTLTFAAGETEKTVAVPVLDDAHDDGGETLTLTLSNASGAAIADASATGTITNDDPLQRAWLARFGRTVGTHVLDAIGDRLRRGPDQGSYLTIGGTQVPLGRGAQGPTNGSTSPGPSLQKRGNNAAPAGTLRLRSGQAQAVPSNDQTVGADRRVRPAPAPQPPSTRLRTGSPAKGESGRGGKPDAADGPVGSAGADGAPAGGTASVLLDSLARVLGLGGTNGNPGDAGPGAVTDPRLNQGQPVRVDLRQLLQGSAFRLNLTGSDPGAAPRLTAWGRVAGTTFQGTDNDLALDGDVLTGTVGLDATLGRWLGGLAVAHSRGNGTYTMPLADGAADAGDLEQTLTSVQPYLRYAVTDRLDVWGLLGYGWGAVEMDMARGGTIETDTTLLLGAVGGRGVLLAPEDTGGFQLATRTDAMVTRTSADAAPNSAATDADAHRVRLLLEGSRGVAWDDGRTLTPTVELGLRHDGGDAETGFGLELGGRVQYADPRLGLTVDAAVRGLLAHEDAAYDEWGASGTVRLAPGANGQGLSLTLAPAWGATASGVQGLWTRQTTQGLAPQGQQQTPGGQLAAEVGYGLGFGHTGLVTPYAGTVLADGVARTVRVGARLQVPGATTSGLTLSLEGTRQEAAGQQPVNQGLRLDLTWGF